MATIPNPELTYAVVPRVAAFFSFSGSAWIASEVLRDKKKREKVYHRVMLGMSVFDMAASICFFLGRWPLPPDAPLLPGGIGNQQTCTAQAFFGQAGLATVAYNCTLAFYYLLVVKYGMTEKEIAKRIEKWMHALPVVIWLSTGAAGIALEVFNPAFFDCWIAPVPINCAAYGEKGDDRPPCTRGYLAPIFQWAIYYAPVWFMILLVTAIMLAVYCSVAQTEKKNDRYSSAEFGRASASRKYSRRVAKQGLWYLLPFYATWIFPVATEITEMATGKYYDPMVVLVSFFLPFQGALNFLVYMRPRYLKYKNQHPEKSFFSIIGRTLKRSLCCIKDEEDDDRLVTDVGNSGYFRKSIAKLGRRISGSRRGSSAMFTSTDNMMPEENNSNADAQENKVFGFAKSEGTIVEVGKVELSSNDNSMNGENNTGTDAQEKDVGFTKSEERIAKVGKVDEEQQE